MGGVCDGGRVSRDNRAHVLAGDGMTVLFAVAREANRLRGEGREPVGLVIDAELDALFLRDVAAYRGHWPSGKGLLQLRVTVGAGPGWSVVCRDDEARPE